MKKHVKQVLKKRKDDLSIPEFQKLFSSEEACRNYLFKSRWPDGFICPECSHTVYYLIAKRHLYQCVKCNKQHSVIAGTIFQDTHLPLQKWFWAMYLIARDKRGYSALALKNAIQVSYPTAWRLFHKIRLAMARRDKTYILKGDVIISRALFGGIVKDKKHENKTEPVHVLVAISLDQDMGNPLFAKMIVVENMKNEVVSKAMMEMVEPGSRVHSDIRLKLARLKEYRHELVKTEKDEAHANDIFRWADVVISNTKSYISGTYHGLPKIHLQKYLNEFCYRLNRRFCEPLIFEKLVNACLLVKPSTYPESSL